MYNNSLFLILPFIYFTPNHLFAPERISFGNELSSFSAYADRVKHIVLQHDIVAHDGHVGKLAIALPKLRSLRLSMTKSTLPLSLLQNLSNLDTADFSLGFKSRPPSSEEILCLRFREIAQLSTRLRNLRLRGSIPASVNVSLCQMTALQSVSLRLGNTMSVDVLAALGTFPSLSTLEVHAGHLSTDAVRVLMDDKSNLFPVLTKLYIRAKSSFVELFVSYLSTTTLQHLHVELDDERPFADTWTSILQRVSSKASASLQHLDLEHHYNLDDIQQNSTPNTVATTPPPQGTLQHLPSITLGDVGFLRSAKRLRHFSCNLTIPPSLSDSDFEQVLSWWPQLEHLDLGPLPDRELSPSITISPSSKVISMVTEKASQLLYLSVPCSLDDTFCRQSGPTGNTSIPHNRLKNLTVSAITTTDPTQMARCLLHLLPSLQTLECIEPGDHGVESLIPNLNSPGVQVG
ncbi:hypothetical protein CVT24_003584 [Panaeolus cyanescens]|uniref:F-box domain-containing protein n=1 Tax=Panaeolus cyanescens TaxID=181874 RepID=A0A409Y7D9_9AGAR|nr:hypothetical protein CVT24_003584 [Panaeolus cyanescens]